VFFVLAESFRWIPYNSQSYERYAHLPAIDCKLLSAT